MTRVGRGGVCLAFVGIVLCAVAGCTATPESTGSATHSSARASASASPAAPSPSSPAANVIAVITATAHNKTGGAAQLRLEVDAPRPITAADTALLHSAQCDQNEPAIADPEALPLTLTTSSASWSSDYLILPKSSGLNTLVAWSGAWTTFQAYCSDGLAVVPGTATGILVVSGSAPVDSTDSWGSGEYGFSEAVGVEGDVQHDVTMTDCHIALGPAAKPSARVSAFVDSAATSGCIFGNAD